MPMSMPEASPCTVAAPTGAAPPVLKSPPPVFDAPGGSLAGDDRASWRDLAETDRAAAENAATAPAKKPEPLGAPMGATTGASYRREPPPSDAAPPAARYAEAPRPVSPPLIEAPQMQASFDRGMSYRSMSTSAPKGPAGLLSAMAGIGGAAAVAAGKLALAAA